MRPFFCYSHYMLYTYAPVFSLKGTPGRYAGTSRGKRQNGPQTAIGSPNAPGKVFCKTLLGLPCRTIVNKLPLMEDFNLLIELLGIVC